MLSLELMGFRSPLWVRLSLSAPGPPRRVMAGICTGLPGGVTVRRLWGGTETEPLLQTFLSMWLHVHLRGL